MGNFFTLPSDFLNTLTAFIGGIFGDMKPLIMVLVGLFIGFYVLERFLDVISDWSERRRIRAEYEAELKEEALRPTMRRWHAHEVERKRGELFEEI